MFVGGVSGGVTPGPIPNPEAKSTCADGTALGRVWESRSPPASMFCVVCGVVPSLWASCVGVGGGATPHTFFAFGFEWVCERGGVATKS